MLRGTHGTWDYGGGDYGYGGNVGGGGYGGGGYGGYGDYGGGGGGVDYTRTIYYSDLFSGNGVEVKWTFPEGVLTDTKADNLRIACHYYSNG